MKLTDKQTHNASDAMRDLINAQGKSGYGLACYVSGAIAASLTRTKSAARTISDLRDNIAIVTRREVVTIAKALRIPLQAGAPKGVPGKSPGRPRNKPGETRSPVLAEIIKLRRKGLSMAVIGERLNVSRQHVWAMLRKHGA